jgi:lysophospholipase L1-like esterase
MADALRSRASASIARQFRRPCRLLPLPASGVLMFLVLVPGVARASGTLNYVSLGDSYTAGPLIPDATGNPLGCLRSTSNYPSDVAAAIGATSFTDMSCSGATSSDLTESQSVTLGTNPPQLSGLSAGTNVVTLGMGGNDIGFSSIAEECATLSVSNPFGSPCKNHYTSGGVDQLAAAISADAPVIAADIREIHAAAPNARIFVVGYPDILPNTGYGCFPLEPLAFGDVPYLRGVEKELNQMLATAAAASSATYVDTYTPTIGHDICQTAKGSEWIEGLIPVKAAAPFHPNVHGEAAMATAVEAAISG